MKKKEITGPRARHPAIVSRPAASRKVSHICKASSGLMLGLAWGFPLLPTRFPSTLRLPAPSHEVARGLWRPLEAPRPCACICAISGSEWNKKFHLCRPVWLGILNHDPYRWPHLTNKIWLLLYSIKVGILTLPFCSHSWLIHIRITLSNCILFIIHMSSSTLHKFISLEQIRLVQLQLFHLKNHTILLLCI